MLLDTLNIEDLKAFRTLLLDKLNMPVMMYSKSATSQIVISDTMRTTTGRANHTYNRISLNQRLLSQNPHHIEQTFAHELAHIVAVELYGVKAWGHGEYWSRIMTLFGYEPRRCHSLDASELRRRHTVYETHCNCRTHLLKAGRYNKMRRGVKFTCRKCHTDLQLGPKE